MASRLSPIIDLFLSLQFPARRPLAPCKCWQATPTVSRNVQRPPYRTSIRQYATPTKRPPPVMIQHKPKRSKGPPLPRSKQPAAPTFRHPTVGTVVKAGYMDRCVVVRTNTQHWDKFLRKHYPSKKQYLCRDPNNSLIEGDVIEYGPWEGRSWKSTVRVVVERILSPFGKPIDERPEVLDREGRKAFREERERQWIEQGRSVPKKVLERVRRGREIAENEGSGSGDASGIGRGEAEISVSPEVLINDELSGRETLRAG
ncbi:MAG: hypothetical protein Q9160_001543 [Pyrenula sp. 1 TL-2023]